MRVLVWTPFFHPDVGGIESLLAEILPLMREGGIDFSVVASHGPSKMPDRSDYRGIPVHRFAFREAIESQQPLRILELRSRIQSLKQGLRPDLVHVHFADPSVFFHLETSRQRIIPTVVTLHQDYAAFGIEPNMASLLTKALSAATWVTGVSAKTVEGARAFLTESPANTSVIYNGVSDVRSFNVTPIDFERRSILCVGRMVEQKDFATALRVFADLSEGFPDLSLAFAGDGPLEASLRSQADELGLSDRTRFLGRISRDEVLTVLSESTLLLMPSRAEAFPLTLLEAGKTGRPVVATDVGGIREAVDDGKTGIVVPVGNREALTEAAATLLSSPDKCQSMGHAAREKVLREFTVEKTVEQYAVLYDTVVANFTAALSRDQHE
ncbi:MAG: glycosyltransferase family 4 protein [Rhodothermales bacterium]|nr:glycosyltransferase family 4 protein [Rhodothermales bacterium]